jgi:hypothetical protein
MPPKIRDLVAELKKAGFVDVTVQTPSPARSPGNQKSVSYDCRGRDFEGGSERLLVDRGGKGSHRNFVHPKVERPITVSGRPGDDAKAYQVRAIRTAIEEAQK